MSPCFFPFSRSEKKTEKELETFDKMIKIAEARI